MVGYGVLVSILLIVALSNEYVLKSKFENFRRKSKADVSDPAESTLVLSHVMFRHGNRTPELSELYPLDPYLNYSYYPVTHGQLTKAGKRKEYSIGIALRERYDTFLGQYYVPNLVDARSTDRNRTKMSLMLVLASLFPPRCSEVWQPGLNWQPVPYNYVPEIYDDVLYGISCPNYLKLYDEIQKSPEVLTEYEEYRENFTYIAENTGLNVTTIQDVYDLYFGLSTEEEYGFKLPEWTKSVWPDIINEISFKQYDIYTKTTEMKQMAAGYFIQKIIDDSERRINNLNNYTKVYLYSGHENNLGQLFATLDLFEYPHIPTYGSYVLFEVHYINETYGFKIYYQNYDTSSATPRLLQLPACEEFCPLDKFKLLVQEYLPPDGLCQSQE
ncbi:venom acid phosphatase Acph-1-like [Euwallacea similis]|uniref:venom acid phosphatase Acph-1-like n=1 Tax=Euwallacea similis TaxID=1736056 RepID=UPI00344BF0F3